MVTGEPGSLARDQLGKPPVMPLLLRSTSSEFMSKVVSLGSILMTSAMPSPVRLVRPSRSIFVAFGLFLAHAFRSSSVTFVPSRPASKKQRRKRQEAPFDHERRAPLDPFGQRLDPRAPLAVQQLVVGDAPRCLRVLDAEEDDTRDENHLRAERQRPRPRDASEDEAGREKTAQRRRGPARGRCRRAHPSEPESTPPSRLSCKNQRRRRRR